ncbi:hypothetical protein KL928_004231 [Ogataea angusta]|uniref:DUF3533 domain-containing protein n=1 Tax=Pichia angusta TaxID=870730 RepID=A0AAN6I4X6_PICAN|nr:uncharacterized protein KL928_004231 [Ogataea angusta]KAG7816767.1 hypothetical protein KL928_004231 [Ogataea angusta]
MTSSETSLGNDATDDMNQKEPQEYRQDNNDSLMRVVTQYTEYSVSHANEEDIERLERERDEEMAKERQEPVRSGFLSKRYAQQRKKFFKQYAVIIVVLWIFILSVFSIYWGAMYQRGSRLVNLKILLVVEDGASVDNNDYPVSQALLQVAESPAVKPLLGWTRHNYTDEDWVVNEVWKQKYWGAIYVTSNNVSQQLVQALQNGQDLNTSTLVYGYYETARDLNGMTGGVSTAALAAVGGAVCQPAKHHDLIPHAGRHADRRHSGVRLHGHGATPGWSDLHYHCHVFPGHVVPESQPGGRRNAQATELYYLPDRDCAGQLPADLARIQLCERRVPDQAQQRVEGRLWSALDDLVPDDVGGGRSQREHCANLLCCAAAADGLLAGVLCRVQHLGHFCARRGVSGVLPVRVRDADQELIRANEGASFRHLPRTSGQELWYSGGMDRS